jgi:hypothetical protein
LKTLNKSAFSRLFVMAGAEGLEPKEDPCVSRGFGFFDYFLTTGRVF